MGRAGKALKQVLESYGITQNRLAVMMGIDRSNVSRWVNQTRDPSAEAVAEIKDALEGLDPQAAEDFVMLYFYQTDGKAKESGLAYLGGTADESTAGDIILFNTSDGSTEKSISISNISTATGDGADGSNPQGPSFPEDAFSRDGSDGNGPTQGSSAIEAPASEADENLNPSEFTQLE